MHPTSIERCHEAVEALQYEQGLINAAVSALAKLEHYYEETAPQRAHELMKVKNRIAVQTLVGPNLSHLYPDEKEACNG